MACAAGTPPVGPAFDTIANFAAGSGTAVAKDYVLASAGTRNNDFGVSDVAINITVPGTAVDQAYLYINLLCEHDFIFTSIDFDGNTVSGVDLEFIAYTGNSGWLSDTGENPSLDQNIHNRVYRANVTPYVNLGTDTYPVNLPGVTTGDDSGDGINYPTCTGSNGIALLVIYDTGGAATRRISIYDGAALVCPTTPSPPTTGGSTSVDFTFLAGAYVKNAKIAFGAGGNKLGGGVFSWNLTESEVLPDSAVVYTLTLNDTCAWPDSAENTVEMNNGGDSFCWFLFVYSADEFTPACPINEPDPSAPEDQLNLFINDTGNIDYVINGVGTRDIDLTNDPGEFSVTVPGAPVEAYLYWNTIVNNLNTSDSAVLNGTTYSVSGVSAELIGFCGNTCWPAVDPGDGQDNKCYDDQLKNRVYRADVTSQIQTAIPTGGVFNASVLLPGITTGDPSTPPTSDTPNFPTCDGSQGICLLVIYQTEVAKRVVVYDGAKLMLGANQMPVFGGSTTYSLTFNPTSFAQGARVTNVSGDAQTTYPDSMIWNGTPLPENPEDSYFNPNKGHLLAIDTRHVPANPNVNNTMMSDTTTLAPDTDCTCWFLFVYSAANACPENDCGEETTDQLYHVETKTGNIGFALAGAGIRDIDTNITPAEVNITIPGTVMEAWLYWNVITGGGVVADEAIIDGNSVEGENVGCTGNTCWSAYNPGGTYDGEAADPDQVNQDLLNRVYRADVTDFVTGTGTYEIEIPNIFPDVDIAFLAVDTPHYPGCSGGQGVALFVIYSTPPVTIERPKTHCCVPTGGTVTSTLTTQIIYYHGAKLLSNPDTAYPPTDPPGSLTYTINFNTKYTKNPKLATAVGDSQSTLPDSLEWNGSLLPYSGNSYFQPNVGNLLHVKTEFLPAHSAICDCGPTAENTVTAETTGDCLCWFLFVYSGQLECVVPTVTPVSLQSFSSPPMMAQSLWNPNPPDCCGIKLPCCGDACLPLKFNISITASTLECGCFSGRTFLLEWNADEQKYILANTEDICGCTLFGWFYCVDDDWTLYLALDSGGDVCSDGINTNYPLTCDPFGGVGTVELETVAECACDCLEDTLTVTISRV